MATKKKKVTEKIRKVSPSAKERIEREKDPRKKMNLEDKYLLKDMYTELKKSKTVDERNTLVDEILGVLISKTNRI